MRHCRIGRPKILKDREHHRQNSWQIANIFSGYLLKTMMMFTKLTRSGEERNREVGGEGYIAIFAVIWRMHASLLIFMNQQIRFEQKM